MAEAVGFEPTCPCGQLHFECSSLQPLRYASMHKYSLFRTNHMISSHLRFTPLDVFLPHFKPDWRILRPIDFTEFYRISFRESRKNKNPQNFPRGRPKITLFLTMREKKGRKNGRRNHLPLLNFLRVVLPWREKKTMGSYLSTGLSVWRSFASSVISPSVKQNGCWITRSFPVSAAETSGIDIR